MKDKKIQMVGHAHLDPVWLWQWPEGFQEVKATFRSVLDRMKEYDDFFFVSSSAAFYEWVEQNDPEMFTEIKERIREGRWEIIGGWWVEPDCNIPCGESFARQILYGQRYFQDKFGKTARVGFNPDSFGHHGMLPQLLKKGGLDYYVFMRPMPNEKGLPGRLFWWEADDGSRVLAYRIPYEYCTWGRDVEKYIRRIIGELKEPFDELLGFFGVGNHGGGPTRENIESIRRMNREEDLPSLIFSTPERFFQKITGEDLPIPVVHDELQHHASGCYAAHSGIKKWNRQAENLLLAAEKFSGLSSWLTGQPYPHDFDRAWKNVLFNQFHDIMAGTSLAAAYDDARNQLGEAMSIAGRNLNLALQAISWKIDIEEGVGMKPVVVFNPHSWESVTNIELEVGSPKGEFTLTDENDRPVPVQTVQSQATAGGRRRICFPAVLPPFGYRLYKLYEKPGEEKFPVIKANDFMMENDRFRLEIDPKTGFIARLHDKKMNFDVFEAPAARPVVIEDQTDTWSHNTFHFNKEVGVFQAANIRLAEHGPVKSVIRVTSRYNESKIIQDFSMYRHLDRIDVRVTVDWREQFKMLKLKFPVNLVFRKATSEIPYGHIVRPVNGEEEPGHAWMEISGVIAASNETYGLSIINDCKYSYDILNKEMSLTVLRSPIYAHHDPEKPVAEQNYSFIDQGIQHLTYSLLPHEGGWEQGRVIKHAWELNQPPLAIIETFHRGTLPPRDSFLSVDRENIIVSVIKKAEDGDEMVIRCYETDKLATRAVIKLPKWNREITASFSPCEIKTFKIPKDPGSPAVETNLVERGE